MDTGVAGALEAIGMAAALRLRRRLFPFDVYGGGSSRRATTKIKHIGVFHRRQIVSVEFGSGGGKIRYPSNGNLKLGLCKIGIGAPLRGPSQLEKIRQVTVSCKDMETSQSQSKTQNVYQGVYGPWTIDPSDIREVILYRTGLVTTAASFVVASCEAFLPADFFLSHTLDQLLDFLFLLGVAGLGLSLYLIHIYVTEIKRILQAFWALGVICSFTAYIALARPADQGLVQYVVGNSTAVWFVGPLFAALTGLVFKEGLCYGKLEAGLLAFIIPTLLLGHLAVVMDDGVKLNLLGVWMALFIIFAARKFTQPVKDDIGDKSVFMFNALPEEEKSALLEKLEQQKL